MAVLSVSVTLSIKGVEEVANGSHVYETHYVDSTSATSTVSLGGELLISDDDITVVYAAGMWAKVEIRSK